MAVKPGINRLVELHAFLLAFRDVERTVHLKKNDEPIKENDVEHSYFLAMTAWFLSDYFPHLDRDLLIRFALVHDLVEVHAGDTYIFANEKIRASKHQREVAALKKIGTDWPDFVGLSKTIKKYESKDCPEAQFIYALDKIMPIIAIYINDGYTWKDEELTLAALHENKQTKVSASPEIDAYYQELYSLLQKNTHLFHHA